MALKCKVELQSGLTLNESYIKIIEIGGNKESQNIRVAFYNSKIDYSANKPAVDSKLYSFVPNLESTASNFIQQGYEYLKTLGEYKEAVDLLDEGQTI